MGRVSQLRIGSGSSGRAAVAAMLAVFIAWSFSAGIIGGYLNRNSDPTWYDGLAKPAFNPPGWVFGPVWSVLYLLMGVSAWLVWCRKGAGLELLLFAIQWSLNALWTVLFFTMQSPSLAFAEIIVLWVSATATALAFWRANRLAGYLFVPYILWLTFAAVLNGSIWWLNLPAGAS